ncbi:MAG: citrate/2-methylcitrate synthase [Planctomyces sp.]|nr:citrate/2-methylcitrate synthase [Planctomyces sp.]
MERSRMPAPHLVNGLRRLVNDLSQTVPLPGHGLSGIPCSTTELISFQDDSVQYCGEPIEELMGRCSFEEVIWLLLNQKLPSEEQLADMEAVLVDAAVVDSSVVEMIERIPLGARPLDLFPLIISLLSFFDPAPHDQHQEATRSRVWRLFAQIPVMIAAGLGRPLVDGTVFRNPEHTTLSWAGRLLQCLRDVDRCPTPVEDEAMNSLMIAVCLTELRPSCFAARFSGSTVNHIASSLQSAATLFVAQLRNDPFEWSSRLLSGFTGPESVNQWWKGRQGQAMPFGFSGPSSDPRPGLLREICHRMLGSYDRIVLESSTCRLEKILEPMSLYPTTDWNAARLMTLLDIPSDRQSLVIAMARMAGWAAQSMEQQRSGVPLLPVLHYSYPASAELASDDFLSED